MGYGSKGLMGMGAEPSTHKRASTVNMASGNMMGSRTPGEGKGLVVRSNSGYSKTGAGSVGTGAAKPAFGAKSTKSASKLGTQGITSQGDKGGGIPKGNSRRSVGKNMIGAGRQQSIRG